MAKYNSAKHAAFLTAMEVEEHAFDTDDLDELDFRFVPSGIPEHRLLKIQHPLCAEPFYRYRGFEIFWYTDRLFGKALRIVPVRPTLCGKRAKPGKKLGEMIFAIDRLLDEPPTAR